MKPVKQKHKGDCLRACVASLLELDIDDVPDWRVQEDSDGGRYPVWWLEMQTWLRGRGWFFLQLELATFDWIVTPWPSLAIFIGKRPGSGSMHAVIGEINETSFITKFDPFTGKEGADSVKGLDQAQIEVVAFLVPLDPHSMKLRREISFAG